MNFPVANWEAPFQFSHAPCPSHVYLVQRSIFRAIIVAQSYDPFWIEESFLNLMPDLIQRAFAFQNPCPGARAKRLKTHRERVLAAEEFIARRFDEKISLEDIADHVQCSVFHLCSTFKKVTGRSLHGYLSQLRIRSALEKVLDHDRALTEIALDHGYSSHGCIR